MITPTELHTDRLLLRQWRDADRGPFATLNADPRVMEHFPATLDRAASDAALERGRAHIEAHGWGFWALEILASGEFAGFVGLKHAPGELPFAPAVEIGWRLGRQYWGRGYATEAARAAFRHGFGALQLDEIVSFTAVANRRSQQVMERLQMQPDGTFEHPALPAGHRLRRHALYRIRQDRWLERRHSGHR